MLSNIYLHTVLDEWFESQIKPLLQGKAFLVRFADDFVIGFEVERDARRVMDVLPKRFERFGLAIHPDKTRMVDFRAPHRHPNGKPETKVIDKPYTLSDTIRHEYEANITNR